MEGHPEVTRPAVPKRTHSEKGIIVEGLSNCLVKFSKCCTPVPGDDIVGFITKGYGVSVHRRDCPNADPARRSPNEKGRWIKVSWADDVEGTFRTTLQVVAKDRINLIMDISTVLSSTKTHVGSLNARSTPDGFALITLDTDISSSDQLKTVMRRIEQISGVMRVTRPAGSALCDQGPRGDRVLMCRQITNPGPSDRHPRFTQSLRDLTGAAWSSHIDSVQHHGVRRLP